MRERGTLTAADLAEFPDDGVRRELLGGAVFVTPSPSVRHQRLSVRLTASFAVHLSERGGGMVFHAPLDVILSEHDVVEPDLIVVLDGQAGIVGTANIAGAPGLLIEIVSDVRTDRVRKRDLYARSGVAEYWIVDPEADRVEVHHLEDGRYGKPEIFESGDVIAYEPLPGFFIDLTGLFAR